MASKRKHLAAVMHQAADDLHALAGDLTAIVDVLPWRTPRATRLLLEHQAIRAKAIAAALRAEAREPDTGVASSLLAAGRFAAAATVAALAAVGTGGLEEIGADAWDAARQRAERVVTRQLDRPQVDDASTRADSERPEEGRDDSYRPDNHEWQRAEHIGRLIRESRFERHLSQAQLGAEIGYGRTTISNWERGRVIPTYQALRLLRNALRLSEAQTTELFTAAGYNWHPHDQRNPRPA